jgi:hypothetical protein
MQLSVDPEWYNMILGSFNLQKKSQSSSTQIETRKDPLTCYIYRKTLFFQQTESMIYKYSKLAKNETHFASFGKFVTQKFT